MKNNYEILKSIIESIDVSNDSDKTGDQIDDIINARTSLISAVSEIGQSDILMDLINDDIIESALLLKKSAAENDNNTVNELFISLNSYINNNISLYKKIADDQDKCSVSFLNEYSKYRCILLCIKSNIVCIKNDLREAEKELKRVDIAYTDRKEKLFDKLYDNEEKRDILMKLMDKSANDAMSADEKLVRQELLDAAFEEECLLSMKNELIIRKKETDILKDQTDLLEYKIDKIVYPAYRSFPLDLITELGMTEKKSSKMKSDDMCSRIMTGTNLLISTINP